ncbi:twin-arginine translocation signal domain-containing protein [Candidatus Poribacteria bacterium]
MAEKSGYCADELKEKLNEVVEETDENDRRAFLKTAAKVAGAMAISSVVGALVDDEAVAGETPEEGGEPLKKPPIPVVRNMRMNIANKSNSRQLSFSGRGLGAALQAQGFIPSSVKNLNNVSFDVFLKW